MYLMQRAIFTLRFKGVEISEEEESALLVAILLHDIGHGPFSHAMEHSIVHEVSHEKLSLLFMNELNQEMNGALDLALRIFKNQYERKFMHQLISGQMDMDRLDYLRRDSFYTGVAEGTINSQRLIAMLNVKEDRLVVEEKAIYSVEKFLIARRLMYWQVYLHKTSLAAEQLLVKVLQRAKLLSQQGHKLPASSALSFFLTNTVRIADFNKPILDRFAQLDDYDIVSALKEWTQHGDYVLSELSSMLLNRELPKIKIKNKSFSERKITKELHKVMSQHNLSEKEASYFVFTGDISNLAYHMDKDNIYLLKKNGKLMDVAKASDQLNLKALSKEVVKHYLCYPK